MLFIEPDLEVALLGNGQGVRQASGQSLKIGF
jgi:hypothetical protein